MEDRPNSFLIKAADPHRRSGDLSLSVDYGRCSSAGFSVDGHYVEPFMRSLGVKQVSDLVGRTFRSTLLGPSEAVERIAVEQIHRELGREYVPPSAQVITDQIAMHLAVCVKPNLTLFEPTAIYNAIQPFFFDAAAQETWFETIAREIVFLSRGNVSLVRLSPGEPGFGGIMGPAIYAKLVRPDQPPILLSLGPYGKPVYFRR